MAGLDGNPDCPLAVNGFFGYATCHSLQWKLNQRGRWPALVLDGQYGALTSKALEWYLALSQAGSLFPNTGFNPETYNLQDRLAATGFPVVRDGKWGPGTTKGVQASLNSTRF